MRTTVTIREDLLKQARKLALERSCTLSALVEDALQQAILADAAIVSCEPTRLPTFRGRGLQGGIDLDDTASLLDAMEGR